MRIEASDINDLKPLIRQVVLEVLDSIRTQGDRFNGRLAYSEAEAAALLGVQRHVLRDCRLRGEVKARRIGKEYRYCEAELRKFLTDIK